MRSWKLLLTAVLAAATAAPALAQDFRPYRFPDRWRDQPRYDQRDPSWYSPSRGPRYDQRDSSWYHPPDVRPQEPPVGDYDRRPEARDSWVYRDAGGGEFRHLEGKRWVQYASDGQFNFREMARTPDYVELFDAQRNLAIRIYPDRYNQWTPEQRQWVPMLAGHWR